MDILSELTTIVHYLTPYSTTNGQPCIISFALSNDVTINTIGWPTIATFGMNLLIAKNIIQSTITKQSFSIMNQEPKLGLPAGIHYNPADFHTSMFIEPFLPAHPSKLVLHQFTATVTPQEETYPHLTSTALTPSTTINS